MSQSNAAVSWRKANASKGTSNCIEFRGLPGRVCVRDSKDPNGPQLTFTPAHWRSLLTAIKNDSYAV